VLVGVSIELIESIKEEENSYSLCNEGNCKVEFEKFEKVGV